MDKIVVLGEDNQERLVKWESRPRNTDRSVPLRFMAYIKSPFWVKKRSTAPSATSPQAEEKNTL